jgi:hypothetical protein
MRMNEAPDPPPPGAIPPGFEHKVKSTAWAVPSRTRQAFFSLRVAPRSLPSG